jgi:hypothetical protein
MNKKTDAQLKASQERMRAQRESVAKLLKATKWSGPELQVRLNQRLPHSERIFGESYFAKKLQGNRGGFRGRIEEELAAMCLSRNIPWEPSKPKEDWWTKLRRLRLEFSLVYEDSQGWDYSPEQLRTMEIHRRIRTTLSHTVDLFRQLPIDNGLAKKNLEAIFPYEFKSVAADVAVRDQIFGAVEMVMDIPRRYRMYHDVEDNPEFEFFEDPYYERLGEIRARLGELRGQKKVAKK